MLATLLKETCVHRGVVDSGSTGVGYCTQQPWLLADTIRENIVFGEQFHLQHYLDTISDCALIRDLERLRDGDLSVLGDTDGIQLSGGQRQRIALARAIYAARMGKDAFLFDEPLSAVDAHVAQWLFERALGPKSVLKHCTRIVVTHRIQFAPEADMIIVMKDGGIDHIGTYSGTL